VAGNSNLTFISVKNKSPFGFKNVYICFANKPYNPINPMSKLLFGALLFLAGILSTTTANAQCTFNVDNTTTCDYTVQLWIYDSGGWYVSGGIHIAPALTNTPITIVNCFSVELFRVFDASGGTNHANVSTINTTDIVGGCTAGTFDNVDWISNTDGIIY
jgi:hypothetical protein